MPLFADTAHSASSATHASVRHDAEVHCGHELPLGRWRGSPGAWKGAAFHVAIAVFFPARKLRPRNSRTSTKTPPPSSSSRGPSLLGDQASEDPSRRFRSARLMCLRELEQMPPQSLGCGAAGEGGVLPFVLLQGSGEHSAPASGESRLHSSLSLTVRAWRRRGQQRRPCVPWGRPRAWTGRGSTASLRRGGVGAGRRDEKSASNLREKSGERQAESERAKKKNSSPPKRFGSQSLPPPPPPFSSLLQRKR